MFQVGSETTGNTLAYALLFLIQNPSVQDKLFEEIDSTFPDDELPTWADRERLEVLSEFIVLLILIS